MHGFEILFFVLIVTLFWSAADEGGYREVFARKLDLNDEDWIRVVFDKYVCGEITDPELQALLGMIRPKQLKHRGEFSGYE